MDWHGPFSGCVLDAHVEQLEQAVFIGKRAFGFSQFAELAVYGLNRVGGVDYLADVSRIVDNRETPLALIQTAILTEIAQHHGWWLGSSFEAAAKGLSTEDTGRFPRSQWLPLLRGALTGLYATRPMSLAALLLRYLEKDRSVSSGAFMAGVADFERVWETMLRKSLPGEETKRWNSRLPKPAYVTRAGDIRTIGSGMEMDIVVRNRSGERDHLHILDAKYYAATGIKTVPKTGDIVKQLMYETAMRAAIENKGAKESVSSGFIFPAGHGVSDIKPFVCAGLENDKEIDLRFPSINIHYADVTKVMTSYISRESFELDLVCNQQTS